MSIIDIFTIYNNLRKDISGGPMITTIPTLDDLKLAGKRVFLRADMNVPLDKDGRVMDSTKIKEAVVTIKELLDIDAKLVIGTHQGKPGSRDFVPTDFHAELLSKELGMHVEKIDGIACKCARDAISKVKPGELVLLENLRFNAEENLELPPEKAINTSLVRRLAPLFDVYINDAFHASHRSQPSLVGFPYLMPSAAGRIMERMLIETEGLENTDGRRIYVLGGGKIADKFNVMIHALAKNRAQEVLVGGLVGVLMCMAAGYSVGKSRETFKDLPLILPVASDSLRRFRGRIFYPVDFVVLREDKTEIVPVYSVPDNAKIVDVGPGTIELFRERMKEADLVIANGPMGIFENPRFRKGTLDFVKAAIQVSKELVLCGGHLSAAARMIGTLPEGKRIFTAGGALMFKIAGLPMPAINALREGVS